MKKSKYNGTIIAGSLLLRESQIIARLLLEKVDDQAWYQAIVIENVLQKRSHETAKRQARLIKSRLVLMKSDFWKLIDKGSSDVVIQALLAASIKHSRLIGDFMDKIIRNNWDIFKKNISTTDWYEYLEMCEQVDPHIQNWKDATRSKLKQVVFRILKEAKYVNNTRSLELLPVSIIPEIKTYLLNNSENYVLKCMEITP